MNLIWIITLFILTLSDGFSDAASPPVEYEQSKGIEISDKFNEVRFGVNEQIVYMTFTENVREIVNKQFENKYRRDLLSFTDSEGNFIIGSNLHLNSNKIEIPLEDIKMMELSNGQLNFVYEKPVDISFEDVESLHGTQVLNSFYVEDLERLVLAFRAVKN